MCGFVGAVDFERPINQAPMDAALQCLNHRGPDAYSSYVDTHVYLGHKRLSIIDLSPLGEQPMKSQTAQAWIIFNGEIYNYKELREQYLPGVRLRSTSDTEVLLEGYLRHGALFFERLRGIYAFAIYDARKETKIMLGRDPAGVKPLYFYRKGNHYVFGSEIKSIVQATEGQLEPHLDFLKSYINLGYCLEPFTAYKDVMAVKPGTTVTLTSSGEKVADAVKYDFGRVNSNDYKTNLHESEELLKQAVRRNLVADVEINVALSGGIDSSLIYAISNQESQGIRGITVRFKDEEYSEATVAKRFAESIKAPVQEVEIDRSFNLEMLNRILLHFDQPYSDSSAIPVYFLTKASAQYTKVLIGGDGGDELYNGYPSMTLLNRIYNLRQAPLVTAAGRSAINMLGRLTKGHRHRQLHRIGILWNSAPSEMAYDWLSWFGRHTTYPGGTPFRFGPNEGLAFFKEAFEEEVPKRFDQKIVFDYFRKQMLSDFLRKTDMMSMLNSIEYRVPLLDEDLTRHALSIPFHQKSDMKVTKKMLREIHTRYYPKFGSELPKKGFSIPLDVYLTQDEWNIIRHQLLNDKDLVRELVKKEYIEFLFKSLKSLGSNAAYISRASVYQRILILYSLHLWYHHGRIVNSAQKMAVKQH